MSLSSDLDYPRRVVVDDIDPRITYEEGTWTLDVGSFDSLGVFGAPYNHTMHGTKSNGASFSFQFSGEFVQVRGAKENRRINQPQDVTSDNTTALAKWTCQVDGRPIQVTPYRESMYDITHNMLCEQGRLSRTAHTLTLNVTIDDPDYQIWWLDRIEYAPLPDAKLEKEVLKVDGSDPSIHYDNGTGNWFDLRGLYNGTGTTGASMTFYFNGTGVSLYGFNEGLERVWQSGGGRYFVDNSGDTTFVIPGSQPLPSTSDNRTDWYNQLLFTAPDLSAGSHKMVIAYTGVAQGSGPVQWLSIDYFYVMGSVGGAYLNSSSAVPGGSASRQHSSDKAAPVGAFVGGVIGEVVGLALIALAIFFFVRGIVRRKKREKYERTYYDSVPLNLDDIYAIPNVIASGALTSSHPPSSPSGTTPMSATSAYDPYHDSANRTSFQYGGSTVVNSPSLNPPLSPLVSNRLSVVIPFDEGSATGTSGCIQSPSASISQNWTDITRTRAHREVVSPTVVERRHDDGSIHYPPIFIDIPPTYTEF
ncbi:hypothetical protein E1B28_006580 [Marasmius oreades]|uniref:Transmembrane protein n=1 Tax=Marasmius oreades TaxID=181124 RepID=A0A9P7S5X4_9AGAR|nr:uncharacterized protein E1B28_006580 [Marasmius oreades]KAG7095892.1 hypothetical protein E1B28_006580 [Marasmius oreades]